MKKTTLAMSALALSLGLALSPLTATAAETASSAATAQQMPSLAPMLEKVMPSVVSINVEGIEKYNEINKVEPMNRALKELNAQTWFAGLRREQSGSRATLPVLAGK